MKNYITVLIVGSMISPVVFGEGFKPKQRVGLGYSSTSTSEWLTKSDKWGDGIRLEYGYELNEIFGINLSYSKNSDTIFSNDYTTDIDGYNIKLDSDIGYKFYVNGVALKPYGSIGVARQSETISSNNTDYSFNEMGFVAGAGLRVDINEHLYSDFRFDLSHYNNNDYDTISWTVGYQF
ncbi:porin family protein [Shewanella sp. WXL01]|uniref:Porin family protein n=1 Tax=Shewanella maritima TaxID=2520507 RepID=A0A411PGS1_9GAMM|nr:MULTISPECIES: porin family protein [Shewanella]NKF49233.1 porin family protein [Shewanella sp. WXL01]QBF82654.1 porin family protein [Shewanella maritima]